MSKYKDRDWAIAFFKGLRIKPTIPRIIIFYLVLIGLVGLALDVIYSVICMILKLIMMIF